MQVRVGKIRQQNREVLENAQQNTVYSVTALSATRGKVVFRGLTSVVPGS